MNSIQKLEARVKLEFSKAKVVMEDNKNAVHPDKCPWYLDILLGKKHLNVEWRPNYKKTLSFCNCGVAFCGGDITCVGMENAIEIVRFCLKA